MDGQLLDTREIKSNQDLITLMNQTALFSQRTPLSKYIASKMDGSKKSVRQFFNGLFEHAKYVPVHGQQDIRTINKVFKDKKANCVDYSITISSVLHNLGVPHGFVLVGNQEQAANHVYVVAYPNGERVVLDCVLEQHVDGYENKRRPAHLVGSFNREVDAPYKEYFPQIKIQTNASKRI